MVVIDACREKETRGLLRKMANVNYIPSQYGRWADGGASKNIAITRIIEDPVFKDSAASYFLQMGDVAAFTLLKRFVKPRASTT